MKLHYFDYAAATPVSASVQALMQPYFADKFYNPSALYLSAQSIKQDITQARITVAELLGCKTSEIIFTGGGTESDNLAIKGIMEKYPDANCIVSSIEHDAVMEPAKRYKHKFATVQE
ncbi:MAG: aminotransferase class V-fold PLP-dependent enzyme, partial [bacterium]|nr:aminotransferase class V-fold PLP-dependent enzyme [bacterium]